MAEQNDERTPSGEADQPNREENQAQAESDALADATRAREPAAGGGLSTSGSRSTANGRRADDEDAREFRKKAYANGATLVSKID